MSHGKRKQLPTSDPEYILSLLEGDSTGESDSDLRATTRILSSVRLHQPALFRPTHPSLTLLQSTLVRETSLSLSSLHQPALFRATTLERLQERDFCRPLLPLFRLPRSHYRPCLLFVLLNESLTLLFLLNFTPNLIPSLVLLLPLHYHHHGVVSVRAAATLGLLMV